MNYLLLARSQRCSGVGRLMVTVMEGCNLSKANNSQLHYYCELSVGDQSHFTKTIQDSINPRWNSSMQFFISDVNVDILKICVFKKDLFSPDEFAGRTEMKVASIQHEIKSQRIKGPINKKLLLREVNCGEIVIKVDLLLFDPNLIIG